MILKVKASRKEFDTACTGGCVYGQFQGQLNIYIYAELGQELPYTSKPSDDPKTSYRLFINCVFSLLKVKHNLMITILLQKFLTQL